MYATRYFGLRFISFPLKLTLFYLCIILSPNYSTAVPSLPVVVTTWSADCFQKCTEIAWKSYQATSSRLQAIVDGCTECEQLQCDGSVGYGGSPDENGQSTLDALLFDGPNHRTGAVAQLKQTRTASRVAWAVMNYTKHSLLVGELADQFALEMNFTNETLDTNGSQAMWQTWRDGNCQPNFRQNVEPDPLTSCGPYTPLALNDLDKSYHNIQPQTGRHFQHDTIGIVIVDKNGDISAGTSTNGASHKIPGRVSDSALVGAGAYVDNDYAGCVATGDGDVMQKFVPCYRTVENMRQGMNPNDASADALKQIARYYNTFQGAVVAVDKGGTFGAACHGLNTFTYSVRSSSFGESVGLVNVTCIDNMPSIGSRFNCHLTLLIAAVSLAVNCFSLT